MAHCIVFHCILLDAFPCFIINQRNLLQKIFRARGINFVDSGGNSFHVDVLSGKKISSSTSSLLEDNHHRPPPSNNYVTNQEKLHHSSSSDDQDDRLPPLQNGGGHNASLVLDVRDFTLEDAIMEVRLFVDDLKETLGMSAAARRSGELFASLITGTGPKVGLMFAFNLYISCITSWLRIQMLTHTSSCCIDALLLRLQRTLLQQIFHKQGIHYVDSGGESFQVDILSGKDASPPYSSLTGNGLGSSTQHYSSLEQQAGAMGPRGHLGGHMSHSTPNVPLHLLSAASLPPAREGSYPDLSHVNTYLPRPGLVSLSSEEALLRAALLSSHHTSGTPVPQNDGGTISNQLSSQMSLQDEAISAALFSESNRPNPHLYPSAGLSHPSQLPLEDASFLSGILSGSNHHHYRNSSLTHPSQVPLDDVARRSSFLPESSSRTRSGQSRGQSNHSQRELSESKATRHGAYQARYTNDEVQLRQAVQGNDEDTIVSMVMHRSVQEEQQRQDEVERQLAKELRMAMKQSAILEKIQKEKDGNLTALEEDMVHKVISMSKAEVELVNAEENDLIKKVMIHSILEEEQATNAENELVSEVIERSLAEEEKTEEKEELEEALKLSLCEPTAENDDELEEALKLSQQENESQSTEDEEMLKKILELSIQEQQYREREEEAELKRALEWSTYDSLNELYGNKHRNLNEEKEEGNVAHDPEVEP